MSEQPAAQARDAGVVEGAGVPLAYREHGQGTPLLLIHGMGRDAEALRPLALALAPIARVISYDRRGYGGSGAPGLPGQYLRTTVYEQAEDAAAVLRGLDATPAIVCGEGLGALVALDLLTREPGLVLAAALVEPPLFALVPSATAALSAERELLAAAVRDGGPALAVQRWLQAQGADASDVARAGAAHAAFFADFAGLASWPVTRGALRAIGVPVAVVTGPSTPPHVEQAADELERLLPAPTLRHRDGDVASALSALLCEAVHSASDG